jgi:hypothetical protein
MLACTPTGGTRPVVGLEWVRMRFTNVKGNKKEELCLDCLLSSRIYPGAVDAGGEPLRTVGDWLRATNQGKRLEHPWFQTGVWCRFNGMSRSIVSEVSGYLL